MSNTPDMQNSAFDDAIRRSLENFEAGDFNPGDWDKMEDRLQHMQPAPAGNPAASRFSGRQLGFAAAMVVATALNILLYTRSNYNNDGTGSATGQVAVTTPATGHPGNPATGPAALQATAPQGAAMKINSPVSDASAPAPVAGTDAKLQADLPATPQAAAAPVNTAVANQAHSAAAAAAAAAPAAGRPYTNAVKQKTTIRSEAGTPATITGTNLLPAGRSNAGLPFAAGAAPGQPGNGPQAGGCAGNSLPEILYAIRGNDTIRDFNFTVAACELLSFRLITHDKNEGDKIALISNVTRILPDAAMHLSNAANPVADFRWLAAPELVRAEPYKFTMLVSDDRCAAAGSNAYTFTVQVVPSQRIKVTAATAELEKGSETTLQVSGAGPKATYTWLTIDGSLSDLNAASPQARPLVTTTYKVRITNMAGCTITDSVTIKVNKPAIAADAAANVPNIITPNGDGQNDYFVVPNLEPGTFKLVVFDRWGRTVYSKEKYDNTWDARDLRSDTYYYLITSAATGQVIKGWVEVLR